MNLPQFTAEPSLFKPKQHYGLMADKAQHVKGPEIVPQRHIVYRGCI